METHPLPPFLPSEAKLLMCGTFPPARSRWSMDFYYPNFINDMWRIFGLIYHNDKNAFVDIVNKSFYKEQIIRLLTYKGIALSDTGRAVIRTRGNASDKFLEIKKSINLSEILEQLPSLTDLATTGEKAATVIANLTNTAVPKMGEYTICKIKSGSDEREFRHWRMPSSSRAYPMRLEEKTRLYENMLKTISLI